MRAGMGHMEEKSGVVLNCARGWRPASARQRRWSLRPVRLDAPKASRTPRR